MEDDRSLEVLEELSPDQLQDKFIDLINQDLYDIEYLKKLLYLGATLNHIISHTNPLRICIYGENSIIHSPILHMMSRESKLKAIKLLIDAGTDPNIMDNYDTTALFHARNRETAQLLVNMGTNIQSSSSWGEPSDILYNALTFHIADANCDIELIKFYMDIGIDINLCVDKISIIHWACFSNDINVLKLAISTKIPIDIQDFWEGETPLHIAVMIGKAFAVDRIKILLEAGANKNALNYKGRTPWDKASEYIREQVPELNPNV